MRQPVPPTVSHHSHIPSVGLVFATLLFTLLFELFLAATTRGVGSYGAPLPVGSLHPDGFLPASFNPLFFLVDCLLTGVSFLALAFSLGRAGMLLAFLGAVTVRSLIFASDLVFIYGVSFNLPFPEQIPFSLLLWFYCLGGGVLLALLGVGFAHFHSRLKRFPIPPLLLVLSLFFSFLLQVTLTALTPILSRSLLAEFGGPFSVGQLSFLANHPALSFDPSIFLLNVFLTAAIFFILGMRFGSGVLLPAASGALGIVVYNASKNLLGLPLPGIPLPAFYDFYYTNGGVDLFTLWFDSMAAAVLVSVIWSKRYLGPIVFASFSGALLIQSLLTTFTTIASGAYGAPLPVGSSLSLAGTTPLPPTFALLPYALNLFFTWAVLYYLDVRPRLGLALIAVAGVGSLPLNPLGAFVWIGIMLLFALILVPALRHGKSVPSHRPLA